MSRTAIPLVVIDALGAPVAGASCTVKKRIDNTNATVYAGETGGSTVSNPLATDSIGRVAGWVERGAYNLVVTGTGFTGFTEPYDSAPAADGALDNLWLPSATLPIGAIMPYAGSGDPAGGAWLLCDGRTLTDGASVHAALYGVIGTTFGGSGTSSFQLPDLSGRAVLGVGTPSANSGGETAMEGATAHVRAKKAGKERHTLAAAESGVAAHAHTATDAGHTHAPPSGPTSFIGDSGTTTGFALATSGGRQVNQGSNTASGNASITVANAAAAAAAANHENLPPHLVLNHVIRVL